jgi:arsenate reductase
MITIYHNPRCTKSREGLCEVELFKKPFQIRNYMIDLFTSDELKGIIKKLGISPIELVRTKESVWIENYKNKELSAAEIIEAMLKHPKLIERPIIVYGEKAIIARPKERIKELIR